MTEPVKIVIVMEGGCIHAVLSGGVPVDVATIHYDEDDGEPGEYPSDVPQPDGTTAPGYLGQCAADDDPESRALVAWVFDQLAP